MKCFEVGLFSLGLESKNLISLGSLEVSFRNLHFRHIELKCTFTILFTTSTYRKFVSTVLNYLAWDFKRFACKEGTECFLLYLSISIFGFVVETSHKDTRYGCFVSAVSSF